jgi:hypothetical protein
VTNFAEALRQDVLEESMDELLTREDDLAGLLSAVVAISEGHVTVVQSLEPTVADGHAEEVASQILEDFVPAAGVLAVNDPRLGPELLGKWSRPVGLLEGVAHFGPKDDRQGADRNQKGRTVGSHPDLAVLGKSTGTDQQVDMGVIRQSSGPGMEHGQDRWSGPQVLWVSGQLEHRGGRTLQQGPVEDPLMTKSQRA